MTAPEQYGDGDWFWLSFVVFDAFAGAVLIQGWGETDAVSRSWARGLNPGGEVGIIGPIDPMTMSHVPFEWREKLLSRADCESLEQVMA
jgi:hypothetical protein